MLRLQFLLHPKYCGHDYTQVYLSSTQYIPFLYNSRFYFLLSALINERLPSIYKVLEVVAKDALGYGRWSFVYNIIEQLEDGHRCRLLVLRVCERVILRPKYG